MPFKIAFRERMDTSFFQRYLHLMAGDKLGEPDPIGELWIASGYFNGKDIKAETHHKSALTLSEAIAQGCNSVTVMACMNHVVPKKRGDWSHAVGLRIFLDSLNHTMGVGSVTVRSSISASWHAKVALRLIENDPICALIGSSNVTRPPYCEGRISPNLLWKHECDVLMWIDLPKYNSVYGPPVETDGETEFLAQAITADQRFDRLELPVLPGTISGQLRKLRDRLLGQTEPTQLQALTDEDYDRIHRT